MVEEYEVYILKKANKDKENIKQFPVLKKNVDKLINNVDLYMRLLRKPKG